MIKQGFIKKIGLPHEWKTNEGEARFSYPLTLSIPYVRQDGKQGEDVIIAEHSCANPDYVKRLEDLRDRQVELDLTLSFAVRQGKDGREFNNIRLSNLSQRIV
ncbi:MAG: hypothetical protein IKP41_03810 [Bacteroidaceae bacterium]|nr:hypothetical protein [Bacteroidaceae bacterium]